MNSSRDFLMYQNSNKKRASYYICAARKTRLFEFLLLRYVYNTNQRYARYRSAAYSSASTRDRIFSLIVGGCRAFCVQHCRATYNSAALSRVQSPLHLQNYSFQLLIHTVDSRDPINCALAREREVYLLYT